MKLSDYRFGELRIDGAPVTSDVIVYPDTFTDHWWRNEGHVLHIEDLKHIIEFHPDKLVVGTGYYGRMQVPWETQDYLHQHNIELISARTSEAVETFNQLQTQCAKVVAALHLTC